jgi:hypothetical protein
MAVKPKNETLERALNKYFSLFDDTRKLVSEFIARREHSAEILILLCARLDAFAELCGFADLSSSARTVSKHRDRAYRGGRCNHWIKIKNPNSPR